MDNAAVGDDVDVDEKITRLEVRLRELEDERDAARRELHRLREQRDAAEERPGAAASSWTADDKVTLFSTLFRGRPDVFAVRWENRAKNRSGWAPRCSNEWKAGVCHKPAVKCGECPNQAFLPVIDTELRGHLQGRQVVGVYALQADDTCWFVAADLDGPTWPTDIAALREVCQEHGLTPAVERSRSGDGAHRWLFFTDPVPAASARALGLMLLTEALARTATLTMASYDRLFPSQDSAPAGGFGNLIALPLQRHARGQHNTVFLDEHLQPIADQWSYLASLPRIAPAQLQQLLAAAGSSETVLGLAGDCDGREAPWRRPRPLTDRLSGSQLPQTVSATLAGRLYVSTKGLPAALLDAIRRLAAFSNPKFLELQALSMSTARTPRVISCSEQLGGYLALPRGCREPLQDLLGGLAVSLTLKDEQTDGESLDMGFTGELAEYQLEAVAALLAHELGVLCGPPGVGKTVMGARLIAERARSTLVLVHRKPLLEQWTQRLRQFLDVEETALPGVMGGGRKKPSGRLDVAMVQSLARQDALDELLAPYGHVVIDECHHVPAATTERVLQAARARYVTGLTATPQRRDGHHPIIAMQCGPVRHTIQQQSLGSTRPAVLRVVRRDTPFDPATLPNDATIQEIFSALAADELRSELIAQDTLALLAERRSPILLTERREHLDWLVRRLADDVDVVALHGDMRATDRRVALERLAEDDPGRGRLVVATGRYIGEGFDDPRLDTLILAMPIAWRGTVVQYAGRLHRSHPGKQQTLIYDYVDAELPVLRRMFAKRLRAYRSLGYDELVEAAEAQTPFALTIDNVG